jgi:membrane protein YqaA with SNARE-associated domain
VFIDIDTDFRGYVHCREDEDGCDGEVFWYEGNTAAYMLAYALARNLAWQWYWQRTSREQTQRNWVRSLLLTVTLAGVAFAGVAYVALTPVLRAAISVVLALV